MQFSHNSLSGNTKYELNSNQTTSNHTNCIEHRYNGPVSLKLMSKTMHTLGPFCSCFAPHGCGQSGSLWNLVSSRRTLQGAQGCWVSTEKMISKCIPVYKGTMLVIVSEKGCHENHCPNRPSAVKPSLLRWKSSAWRCVQGVVSN